jgi:DNA-binding CsgD family transcriptional regulator
MSTMAPDYRRARLIRWEREVLALLTFRQTDQEIADPLAISRRTASSHVAHILKKLAERNRREVGAAAEARLPKRILRAHGD